MKKRRTVEEHEDIYMHLTKSQLFWYIKQNLLWMVLVWNGFNIIRFLDWELFTFPNIHNAIVMAPLILLLVVLMSSWIWVFWFDLPE